MKSATTAPAFRLWTPTGELFPGVGASAVGFGKAMTDIDTKWFNKDAWRVESFLKRGSGTEMWIDPSATKGPKGGAISAVFGYDDMERGIKYRGTTNDSLAHTSEVSYALPSQRVKVAVSTSLDAATFIPKTDKVTTKIFWKSMTPLVTTEAMLKQGPTGTESLNVWAQGEANQNLGYGGMVEYSVAEGKLKQWEAGLLSTLPVSGGVFATRVVTRNGNLIEAGFMPPKQTVSGRGVSAYFKANHDVSTGKTDGSVATEINVCPKLDLKAKFAFKNLSTLSTAFAAIWSAPNGWRVAASLTNPGAKDSQFGVRFAQGSTPPPL